MTSKLSKEIKKKVLTNELILKIIKELNLNEDQINSGIDIFLKIIMENKNVQELEYITKVEIYDEKTIVGISVPNKKISNLMKQKKYLLLNEISNIKRDIAFANPKNKIELGEQKPNLFYVEYPNLKDQNNRTNLFTWYANFRKNLEKGKYSKGVYIYGKSGLGKTFFLIALANLISEKFNKTVSFINVNDLYEFLTKNVDSNNNSLNIEVINTLKNVEILIIDDIGSEKQSNWFLFSILYPIIDYRLKEEKPTCFSSYFSLPELKKYWSRSKELDYVKVERLIDKIKSLVKVVHLEGKNIRDI